MADIVNARLACSVNHMAQCEFSIYVIALYVWMQCLKYSYLHGALLGFSCRNSCMVCKG